MTDLDLDGVAGTLAIEEVSAESGVPAEHLTTIGKLYPPLRGEPYATTVTLAPGLGKRHPSRLRWESHVWRKFAEQERQKK